MIKCAICGTDFKRNEKRIKCCSKNCGRILQQRYFEGLRVKNKTRCKNCGIEFIKSHKNQVFCGHKCHAVYTGFGNKSDNIWALKKYYQEGNKPWNFSKVGKGIVCIYCGSKFDVHPHKIKIGKGVYCSVHCYRQATHNPEIPEKTRERQSPEYKEWRWKVFKRDGYRCKKCSQNGYLEAHHIQAFNDFPKLRLEVSNGLTLCVSCHCKVHKRTIKKYFCVDCGKEVSHRRVVRCFHCHQVYASHSRWKKYNENKNL